MNPFDNPATIPTLSAFGGSVIGALSSTLSAWVGQRQRERRELVANKVSQLERLYSDFINESARLLVDAVQHSLQDPSTLVPIYALISRIRLRSSTEVIESGERLLATILKVYIEPNLTPEEIQAAANKHNDHLQEFSNVCRGEKLESLGKSFLTTFAAASPAAPIAVPPHPGAQHDWPELLCPSSILAVRSAFDAERTSSRHRFSRAVRRSSTQSPTRRRACAAS